ncbi:thiol-disulfide isomerase/thioredoxin [Caldalkalibacillus uzonensis]|uniref:Thiol-disulfide isomerase/thioredoxin n=1 Tax=Caldalkalibacillus uzonensis TaxID=353224 RepID=A0ABU0CLE9_9BACI|nr:thioredoxin family protein [Caldalkalibacillus uzonensis]MDQ0337241.1 thiol-disulfide isomerase/thioredoxin [Caldalkalibacillus uzonensis]
MKKVILFGVIIFGLFSALGIVTYFQQQKAIGGNPYGKDRLHPETVKQLDNPLYHNQILPEALAERIQNGEELFIYYYQPDCPYCQEVTPNLVGLAKEKSFELYLHNLREFPESWETYGLDAVPAVVHYKEGEELSRIVGFHDRREYEVWFEMNGVK